MTDSPILDLRKFIRNIPDFPKPGIMFRDITPLLQDYRALAASVEALAQPFRSERIDAVLGIESRGFIFGTAVAHALGTGFVIVRKAGKLPSKTVQEQYALEYGTDVIEMHVDGVREGQRVIIVDDLIATGGTAAAAVRLAQKGGAEIVGCAFLLELCDLGGRSELDVERIHSVIEY